MNSFFRNTQTVNKLLLNDMLIEAIDNLKDLRLITSPGQPSERAETECRNAEQTLLLAHELYKKGKINDALTVYQEIAGTTSSNSCTLMFQAHALQSKAWALYRKGHIGQALDTFAAGLRRSRDPDAVALIESQLCSIKWARPDLGDSQPHCDRAVYTSNVSPEVKVDVLVRTSTIERKKGRYSEALRQLATADELCSALSNCEYADFIRDYQQNWAA